MDSPRGRIYLMKSLAEGSIELDDDAARHLDLCLGCRGCETACPSGVHYGRLIEGARSFVEQHHRRGLIERIKRGAVATIFPGQRIFPGFENQPASIVSITTVGLNDLYVFLAGYDGADSATIQVFMNPLVPLVWSGGVLMLLGGIACWWPERRRTGALRDARQLAPVEVTA